MDKIILHGKEFVPFIRYDELSSKIDAVAKRISDDYKDSEDVPVLLCILNGSIMFASELMKRLEFPLELVSMKLSSYCGTESTGKVKRVMGPTTSLEGRRVIICEDIVDTGNTMVTLRDYLENEQKVKDFRVCTLLCKPEMYHKDVPLDYIAINIPNRFIVGFGLDYDEIGRNLKDIYVLNQ
ncbi:MAG: hypoxanthine phosphoribosyltransferase [Bacteroidales bacterium]|nr:hypoxanthine phosphoribosyltransferase [Bacteroidales bacterium]